jgi:hypothetical protein
MVGIEGKGCTRHGIITTIIIKTSRIDTAAADLE